MRRKTGRTIAVALAATGLVLSAVLEYVHIKTYLDVTADSFCRVGEQLDCATVALSRFSVLLGVPLPVWGMVGFLSMLVAAWKRSVLLLPLAAFGAAASVALFFESWLHVGSFCLFCEGVHLIAIALAVLAWKMPDKEPVEPRVVVSALVIPGLLWSLANVLIPPYWVFASWNEGPPAATGLDDDGHHWLGVPDAPLTLHEFVDYHCPHCAIASNLMKMRLVEGESFRVVRRHQPRNTCKIHDARICGSIRAAHCAGAQGKFWEMDNWLFAHVAGKGDVDVRPGAEVLGLDLDAFDACWASEETWAWAEAVAESARSLRILDTPTYIVGERRYDAMTVRQVLD